MTALLSDHDAVLRAVIANPDDDHPRLAYSDLLEERGEPTDAERAEFIRLQIAHARDEDRSDRVVDRVWELSNHIGTWFDDVDDALGRYTDLRLIRYADGAIQHTTMGRLADFGVRRGFVDSLAVPLLSFLGQPCAACYEGAVAHTPDGAPIVCDACRGNGHVAGPAIRLLTRHPVTRLVLDDWDPYVDPGYDMPYYRWGYDVLATRNLPRTLLAYLNTRAGGLLSYRTHREAVEALRVAVLQLGRDAARRLQESEQFACFTPNDSPGAAPVSGGRS